MENYLQLPKHKISLWVQVTGFFFFGFLFYLCWRFYMERMLSFDGAFYLFQIMQSGSFTCSPGRYADYIPELLPLIAYKMDFPLHTILIIYSCSFMIIHYLIFLFVTLILKNNGAGIAIMLVSCLAYYYGFYLPTVELHESLVLGILLWALIHPEYPYKSQMWEYGAYAAALATIIYMSYLHPLGIFLVAFVLGTEIIGSKRYKDWRLWIVAAVGMGWFLLKFYKFSKQAYDQDQLMPFDKMFVDIANWRHWSSTNYLRDHTWLHFRTLKWLGIFCLLISIRKGILPFLFFLVFAAGFTLIFLANFQNGTSIGSYESYYIEYGFFVGLLFVFIFYHPRRRNLVLLMSLPFLLLGLKKIYEAHSVFTYRLAYVGRIVDDAHKQGGKKYIIDEKCYPSDYCWTPWNIAFETLAYSSLQGADSTVTLFIKKPEFQKLCDTAMNKKNVLLGTHFSPLWYTSDDMPQDYFKLPSTGYAYLTHSQEDTSFHDNAFSASNIKITPEKSGIYANVNDAIAVIPIRFTNSSGKVLPSVPRKNKGIYVTYRLYNSKNQLMQNNKSLEPLETDMGKTLDQGLIVYYPRIRGTFYIEADLYTEGKGSWNIPVQRITLTLY